MLPCIALHLVKQRVSIVWWCPLFLSSGWNGNIHESYPQQYRPEETKKKHIKEIHTSYTCIILYLDETNTLRSWCPSSCCWYCFKAYLSEISSASFLTLLPPGNLRTFRDKIQMNPDESSTQCQYQPLLRKKRWKNLPCPRRPNHKPPGVWVGSNGRTSMAFIGAKPLGLPWSIAGTNLLSP